MSVLSSSHVPEQEDKQATIFLPVAIMKSIANGSLIEFEEVEMDVLRLTFVSPTTRANNKRYRITRNNTGACWTSVPRRWLQNLGAQPGDELVLTADADQQGAYLLRLISKAS